MYSSRDKEFHEGVEATLGTDEAEKKIKPGHCVLEEAASSVLVQVHWHGLVP